MSVRFKTKQTKNCLVGVFVCLFVRSVVVVVLFVRFLFLVFCL